MTAPKTPTRKKVALPEVQGRVVCTKDEWTTALRATVGKALASIPDPERRAEATAQALPLMDALERTVADLAFDHPLKVTP